MKIQMTEGAFCWFSRNDEQEYGRITKRVSRLTFDAVRDGDEYVVPALELTISKRFVKEV